MSIPQQHGPCYLKRSWAIPLLAFAGLWVGGCGPVWYLDPNFAERLAKEENKPLLIYFKVWDSAQHRNMKTKVFEHPAVRRELLDTVNLELEYAWVGPYRERYKVQRPQVCVMCSPSGDAAGPAMYVNPLPTPEAFAAWLKQAKAGLAPPPASAPAALAPASPP